MTPTNKLSIDIFSDVVCPWCFIGKHRLEAALETLHRDEPGLAPKIQWLPFFLNPNTPLEGAPYRSFMEAKFGGPDEVQRILDNVAAAGKTAGVEFNFDKMAVRPNSMRAHRLIQRVQKKRDAGPLKERIMVGHFQRGENIGDIETLVKIAGEFGEDEAATRAFLKSEQGADEVVQMANRAIELGVGGVPFFVFNKAVGMSGAQPPEEILSAISQATAGPR